MNFETREKLKGLIHLLENASYNQGCADESPQQSWTQQKKWDSRTRELREEIVLLLDNLVEKQQK